MNKLIEELENQATTVVEGWSDECGTTRYYEFDRRKFAELIVRECQERVEHYIRDCGEINSLPDTVILKHFGVEE